MLKRYEELTDNEVADLILAVPEHHVNQAFVNSQSNTGICTLTAPVAAQTTWNLTSLSVSQSGPTAGPNATLTIYDGPVATGTVLFAVYLGVPGVPGGISSVGIIQDIPLPRTPQGIQSLQATPGNALNIQVVGTGGNNVSINARFSDGLPTGVA